MRSWRRAPSTAASPSPLLAPVMTITLSLMLSVMAGTLRKCRSAINHCLQKRRITLALRGDLRKRAIDVAEIGGCQFDISRTEVLLHAVQLRGAWYRHDPGLLRQQPCERD